jgi:hypothetical protein
MAITIQKMTKAKPVPAAPKNEVETLEPEKLTDEELVDQYGKLQDAILALKTNPVFAQFEMVQEELTKRLEVYEPDEIIKVIAIDYELEAGACSLTPRKIVDPLKVLNWIGPDAFAKIAKVGVADAEKYLVPDQFAEVCPEPEPKFTKNRKIKVAYLGGNKIIKPKK